MSLFDADRGGHRNAPRKSADRPKTHRRQPHVPFFKFEQGRQTGLQRQGGRRRHWDATTCFRANWPMIASIARDGLTGGSRRRYDHQARTCLTRSYVLRVDGGSGSEPERSARERYGLFAILRVLWSLAGLFVGRHSEVPLGIDKGQDFRDRRDLPPANCLTPRKRSAKGARRRGTASDRTHLTTARRSRVNFRRFHTDNMRPARLAYWPLAQDHKRITGRRARSLLARSWSETMRTNVMGGESLP